MGPKKKRRCQTNAKTLKSSTKTDGNITLPVKIHRTEEVDRILHTIVPQMLTLKNEAMNTNNLSKLNQDSRVIGFDIYEPYGELLDFEPSDDEIERTICITPDSIHEPLEISRSASSSSSSSKSSCSTSSSSLSRHSNNNSKSVKNAPTTPAPYLTSNYIPNLVDPNQVYQYIKAEPLDANYDAPHVLNDIILIDSDSCSSIESIHISDKHEAFESDIELIASSPSRSNRLSFESVHEDINYDESYSTCGSGNANQSVDEPCPMVEDESCPVAEEESCPMAEQESCPVAEEESCPMTEEKSCSTPHEQSQCNASSSPVIQRCKIDFSNLVITVKAADETPVRIIESQSVKFQQQHEPKFEQSSTRKLKKKWNLTYVFEEPMRQICSEDDIFKYSPVNFNPQLSERRSSCDGDGGQQMELFSTPIWENSTEEALMPPPLISSFKMPEKPAEKNAMPRPMNLNFVVPLKRPPTRPKKAVQASRAVRQTTSVEPETSLIDLTDENDDIISLFGTSMIDACFKQEPGSPSSCESVDALDKFVLPDQDVSPSISPDLGPPPLLSLVRSAPQDQCDLQRFKEQSVENWLSQNRGKKSLNFGTIPAIYKTYCFNFFFVEACANKNCRYKHQISREFVSRLLGLSVDELKNLHKFTRHYKFLFQKVYRFLCQGFAAKQMRNELMSMVEYCFVSDSVNRLECIQEVLENLQATQITFQDALDSIINHMGLNRYPELGDILMKIVSLQPKLSDHCDVIRKLTMGRTELFDAKTVCAIINKSISYYPINLKLCQIISECIVDRNLVDVGEIPISLMLPLQKVSERQNNVLFNASRSVVPPQFVSPDENSLGCRSKEAIDTRAFRISPAATRIDDLSIGNSVVARSCRSDEASDRQGKVNTFGISPLAGEARNLLARNCRSEEIDPQSCFTSFPNSLSATTRPFVDVDTRFPPPSLRPEEQQSQNGGMSLQPARRVIPDVDTRFPPPNFRPDQLGDCQNSLKPMAAGRIPDVDTRNYPLFNYRHEEPDCQNTRVVGDSPVDGRNVSPFVLPKKLSPFYFNSTQSNGLKRKKSQDSDNSARQNQARNKRALPAANFNGDWRATQRTSAGSSATSEDLQRSGVDQGQGMIQNCSAHEFDRKLTSFIQKSGEDLVLVEFTSSSVDKDETMMSGSGSSLSRRSRRSSSRSSSSSSSRRSRRSSSSNSDSFEAKPPKPSSTSAVSAAPSCSSFPITLPNYCDYFSGSQPATILDAVADQATPPHIPFGVPKYYSNFTLNVSLHNQYATVDLHTMEHTDMSDHDVITLNVVIKNRDGMGFINLLEMYKWPYSVERFICMVIADLRSCKDNIFVTYMDLLQSIEVENPGYLKDVHVKAVFEVITFNLLFELEKRSMYKETAMLLNKFNDWDSLLSSRLCGHRRKYSLMRRYILLARLYVKTHDFFWAYEIFQNSNLNLLEAVEKWPFPYSESDITVRNNVLEEFFSECYHYNIIVMMEMYKRAILFNRIQGFNVFKYINPMFVNLMDEKSIHFLRHLLRDIQMYYRHLLPAVFRAFVVIMYHDVNKMELSSLYELCVERGIYRPYKGCEPIIVLRTDMFDCEIELIFMYFFKKLQSMNYTTHNVVIEILLPDSKDIVLSPRILKDNIRSVFDINKSVKGIILKNYSIKVKKTDRLSTLIIDQKDILRHRPYWSS